MGRPRAQIAGGYRRVTVSVPTGLAEHVDKYLAENPEETMSRVVSQGLRHVMTEDFQYKEHERLAARFPKRK